MTERADAASLEFEVEGNIGALQLCAALRVAPGTLVLAGPNGAGKTSVLALLLGTLKATRGRIAVGSRLLYDQASGIDLPPEERGLGYLPQRSALFPQRTALGNVLFGLEAQKRREPRTERESRARSLLDALAVGHLADRYPHTFSAGERQRVALARALAPEPCALLLDEPTAALDASVRGRVRAFLAQFLAERNLPALVVTHDPADAAELGQQVAILEQGRIVQQGTLAELRARPATPFVVEFVAGAVRGG